ncbi:MAG: glycosyltransferase family 4 protein [Gemmatimonadaceae bacterium]
MTGPPKLVILHVDTERGWRGGERQALWLAKSLAGRGHQSIVACRATEPLAQRANQAGLGVESCSPFFEFDPFAVLALRAVIRRRGVHVVHAHTAHAVALAALATVGSDARMVLTRRVDFRLRPNLGSRWKYGRAAAIIAISKAVARALVASGIPEERITVIPSGVDLTRKFSRATPETLAHLGVRRGAPLVVQVSQLVGHKDPLTFVRAIAAVRDDVPGVQALLVGDGPLRGSVESEVARLGLTGTLHVTGYRTDADSLLAAADVVTLSSKEEGLGTVLLDAMSMGKPIAATSGGGIPEVLQQGVSGLLSPIGDSFKLGTDISSILKDPLVADRLSAGARDRATHFSVERTADLTVEVYRRILRECVE